MKNPKKKEFIIIIIIITFSAQHINTLSKRDNQKSYTSSLHITTYLPTLPTLPTYLPIYLTYLPYLPTLPTYFTFPHASIPYLRYLHTCMYMYTHTGPDADCRLPNERTALLILKKKLKKKGEKEGEGEGCINATVTAHPDAHFIKFSNFEIVYLSMEFPLSFFSLCFFFHSEQEKQKKQKKQKIKIKVEIENNNLIYHYFGRHFAFESLERRKQNHVAVALPHHMTTRRRRY